MFDEDFCCREHRDRYFSSFRKGLNRLPLQQLLADPITEDVGAGEVPALPDIAVMDVPVPSEVPAYDVAADPPPVRDFREISISAFEPPPRMADFLPIPVMPAYWAGLYPPVTIDSLERRAAIELPHLAGDSFPGMPHAGAFVEGDPEPLEGAGSALTDGPLALHSPLPHGLSVTALVSASFETVGEAALDEPCIPESLALLIKTCGEISVPQPAVALPCHTHSQSIAPLPMAEEAELPLHCRQLVSTPVTADVIHVAQAISIPSLTPSREAMHAELEEDAVFETSADTTPNIASPMMIPAVPLDLPSPASLSSPVVSLEPHLELNLAASEARPSHLDVAPVGIEPAAPAHATEVAAEIPGAVIDPGNAPAPHSGAPLRAVFGSSVRIKNWRLRITFAKPA